MSFQPTNITPESKVIDHLIETDTPDADPMPGDEPEACADEGAPSVPVTGVPDEAAACVGRQDPLSGSDKAELNDAWITGADSPEWQALLDRPMSFLLPKNIFQDARQTDWKNTTGSFRGWLEGDGRKALSRHVVQQKKGYFPIVFGASAKAEGYTARKADGMKTVDVIGTDWDSGDSYTDALARAESLGLACIGYTSFRDGTTVSYEKRDKVLRNLNIKRTPTSEEMRGYLAHTLRPHILDTLEVVGEEHTEDGVQIVLKHDPLEKFRILFPMAEPLDINSLASTQRASQAIYKAKVKVASEDVV